MFKGFVFVVLANVIWGILPVYWKLLDQVLPSEVMAHRMLWSFVCITAFLVAIRQSHRLIEIVKQPRECGLLLLSSLLIGSNWLIFIYAVGAGKIVEASLGYFLSPLFSVLLGVLFLGERLRLWQWAVVVIASLGVLNQIIIVGDIPLISLYLGPSFAAYSFLRKFSSVGPVNGLCVETLLLSPLAIAYMVWLDGQGTALFLNNDIQTDILLILAGAVTAFPLILFVAGTRLLALSTVGLLFYINPSLQFVLGVGFYGESVTSQEWLTFSLIWLALLIYSLEGQWNMRYTGAAAS